MPTSHKPCTAVYAPTTDTTDAVLSTEQQYVHPHNGAQVKLVEPPKKTVLEMQGCISLLQEPELSKQAHAPSATLTETRKESQESHHHRHIGTDCAV